MLLNFGLAEKIIWRRVFVALASVVKQDLSSNYNFTILGLYKTKKSKDYLIAYHVFKELNMGYLKLIGRCSKMQMLVGIMSHNVMP